MESHSKCLDSISNAFFECKRLYNYYFYGLNISSLSLNKASRQQYILAISSHSAPANLLYDQIFDYHEGEDHLVKEINFNSQSGNRGYFEQWKIVFQRQYYFMKSEFPEALEEFIDCEIDCRELVETLEEDPNTLSDIEFLRAVRFQIIQIFRWLEEQYVNEYPDYEQLLLGERHVLGLPTKLNYIQLSYDNRNEVMRQVHTELNNSFFDITYEDFKRHFLPPKAFRKITWKGSLPSLVLLFYGTDNNKNFGQIAGLKVVNNQTKVILDHFVSKEGKNFVADVIAATVQKVKSQKTVRNSDEIVDLLMKINKN